MTVLTRFRCIWVRMAQIVVVITKKARLLINKGRSICELFLIISSLSDKIWHWIVIQPVQSGFLSCLPIRRLFNERSGKIGLSLHMDEKILHNHLWKCQNTTSLSFTSLHCLKFCLLSCTYTARFSLIRFLYRKFNSLAFFSQINLKFSKEIWFLKEGRVFTRSSKNLSCALR